MKKLLRKLRNRKGITMTEVIIAMAVVTIITGAAISVVVASVQFDAKYQSETYALNACESAVNCVRFADTPEELADLLNKLPFEEKVSGVRWTYGDVVVCIEDVGGTWTVIYNDKIMYEKD